MKFFKGETFADVYKSSLSSLYNTPDYETNPRELRIKEDLDVILQIENPLSSLYTNERRSSQFKYIAAEFMWYFLGRNDVDFISKYASFWKTIQNEDGSANSAYGDLIFNRVNEHGYSQYQWAIESLVKDKDTRQAIMHFNSDRHQYSTNKDFVCTIYGIFHIRNNKLHLCVKMRSNDAILGLPTDIAFFTILQQQALFHLRNTYPDLELGTYTHHIDSYHIYERNFTLVEEMLNFKFNSMEFPVLDYNLINTEGSPTDDLLKLSHSLDIERLSQYPIYKWIMDNIDSTINIPHVSNEQ